MNETVMKLWQFLKGLPKWMRIVIILLIAVITSFLSISCGPTVKVSAKSTTDTLSISISQNVTDSTGVSVSVNPNIQLTPR